MNLKIVAAQWSLGYLTSEELLKIALAALENGFDTPLTRILAGEHHPIMSEVGPVFECMLAQLNVEIPSPQAAAKRIVCFYAQEIVSGAVSPYEGARRIWEVSIDRPEAGIPLSFAGLVSEYEDFTTDQHTKFYGVEHCQRVLKDVGVEIFKEAEELLKTQQSPNDRV